MRIDFEQVSEQFRNWALQHVKDSPSGWMSLDGKAIGGTKTNVGAAGQDFISLVSLYCTEQKLVISNGKVTVSKGTEIPVVKQLIGALKLEDITFTLDALHCQKKQQRQLSKAITTI